MRTFTDEEVREFIRRYARSYFDLLWLDRGKVWIDAKGGYCDWYVAVDARPDVADIAYFMVDRFEGEFHVSGVEY
jgi:hypothetical protein